jgi:predicted nucleotidyltransferase
MDKREDIISKVKQYKQLVYSSNLLKDIEQVYLFGSFVNGVPNNNSDINVAFVVKNIEGNFFDIIPPIHRLTEKVDFRIEPHVVARDTDYAGFLDEIQRTGILVN